jgi:Domain of unknown function (DUF6438)
MKTLLIALALAATLLSVPASAEKPQDRPYAAGSPSGGIPLWNPGDKFVAIAGGSCSGTCPVYELYVFDDGRVIFLGKKYTGKLGVFKKQIGREAYADLVTLVVHSGVLDGDIKRGTCLKDRPMLIVMRSLPDGNSMRMQSLNSGCEGHADLARDIEKQFIDWTEVADWIAPTR